MASPHPPLSPVATTTGQGGTTNTSGNIGASLSGEKNDSVPSMSEEDITALLARLSQKETVTSVLILSRSDGAVIRVSGALSDSNSSSSLDSSTNTKDSSTHAHTHSNTHRHTHSNSISSIAGGGRSASTLAEYASVVWRLVRASEELVVSELGRLGGLTGAGVPGMLALSPVSAPVPGSEAPDDDLRLLRVRTRKGELVVVPDGRFILVVVHDSPGK